MVAGAGLDPGRADRGGMLREVEVTVAMPRSRPWEASRRSV